MGWIVASVFLFALWIATAWFAGYVIMNMYNRAVAFEDELEERVDKALRTLDSCFMEIALVANKPIFFDSPEVRAVTRAIQRSRDAVVYVAQTLDEIEVEDNTDEVTPKDIEPVTKEDPHDPKDAAVLDKEVRDEALKKAVREGKMDVLDPIGSHAPSLQQSTRSVEMHGMQGDTGRASVALARQMDRIKSSRAKKGGTSG